MCSAVQLVSCTCFHTVVGCSVQFSKIQVYMPQPPLVTSNMLLLMMQSDLVVVQPVNGNLAPAGLLLPGLCCAAGRAQAAGGADPQPHQGNRCCCLTRCPIWPHSLAAFYKPLCCAVTAQACDGAGQTLRVASTAGYQDNVLWYTESVCAALHHSVLLLLDTGWEAVMRVRCSRGLRVSTFHGPMFVRSTDLLALPQVYINQTVSSQLADRKISSINACFWTCSAVQCSYTACATSTS